MKFLAALILALGGISSLLADDHAVVLVYHHVSEETPAVTSVTPAVFARHLQYLDENGFTVWPLGRILDTLQRNQALPKNTVAITFDDAYRSVYNEAFPRLRRRGWPFTLFINTDAIDRGYAQSLDWQQIREMVAAGAEVGNHSRSHAHLVRRLAGETDAQWRARVAEDIRHASARLETEVGIKTNLFAYPYGEYSPELQQLLREMDFLGIAQQSGAVDAGSDFLAVPRFPMATGYADLQRFATSLRTRPLPVKDSRAIPGVGDPGYLERLRLTLDEGEYRRNQLACYSAGGQRLQLAWPASKALEVEIDLPDPRAAGRRKINCTAPSTRESGVYYWHSFQWLVRKADGSWYAE